MPYLNVRLATPESATTAQAVATLLTDLAVNVLGKQADVAAVDIQFADPKRWFVGGQPVTAQTFYLEVKLTAGTNTRDEKARFIAEAFAGLKHLLGQVTPTSYIVLQDVNADDWGFGGQTQGYRYIANQVKSH